MIIIISHKVELEKQLDHLRENLLDLTMRNPLLNFRPGAKSIQVINDIAPEIYDLLILQEKNYNSSQQNKKMNLIRSYHLKKMIPI